MGKLQSMNPRVDLFMRKLTSLQEGYVASAVISCTVIAPSRQQFDFHALKRQLLKFKEVEVSMKKKVCSL